jgi:hypothetical protein
MTRETVATVVFTLAGIAGLWFSDATLARLPNALFYAVLVLNTYFSVRFFTRLPPVDRDERLIDAILVAAYVVLAFSIGSPVRFAAVSMALFAAATAKYALLRGTLERTDILDRKITIDLLGLALCAATLLGAILGFPLASAWLQAGVFAAANVYLLAVRPMYAT